jgi:hypothetical protein
MTIKSLVACGRMAGRPSTRDALLGGGVMIISTIVLLVLGGVAKREGWPAASETLKSLAFPCSFMLSMPFWMMKGTPWKAQALIVGGTLLMLTIIGYVAALT